MLKRFFDLVVATSILLLVSPLFLILALLIKIETPGSVFFRQMRVGKDGKTFFIHKFRSMYISTPKSVGMPLTVGDDPRITRVGKYIRRFHVDELCQTIDVILGTMSLVGPRPETPEYVQFYPKDWAEVFKVKPGITGLASIKYAPKEYALLASAKHPEATYIEKILPKKLKYEKFYVSHQSFGFDLYIIFLTIKYFLKKAWDSSSA